MALSGLDIYKLLPKTNCKQCGFATCLAFAMQLAKKAVTIEKCPHMSPEAKKILEASAQPPIKLITIGTGEGKIEIGNESVMFRHEEKFHRPCAIGFIIEDKLSDIEITGRVEKINNFKFERVGQKLDVNLIAVKQCSDGKRFKDTVKLISSNTALNLMLMSEDVSSIKEALSIVSSRQPLVYSANKNNFTGISGIAKEYKVPLVAKAPDLEEISNLTKELNNQGINDIVLDTGEKGVTDKLWDLTQIRRQALKKSNRLLGYPVLTVINNPDPYREAMEAATYIAKYASIVLLNNIHTWEVLSLLTLRQNIYTDPQKPLQIEPKMYAIGHVNEHSPVLITTNFSLSYYTVLGEVEASKVPAYIMSVDTEGMSVLTAWAAEKFTPDKISDSINKFGVANVVEHKNLIIPGYVAVMSGDLEEQSGYKIIVGPKEAAGLPSFLKNLQ